MPRRDKTGPLGKGPRTGRGLGGCKKRRIKKKRKDGVKQRYWVGKKRAVAEITKMHPELSKAKAGHLYDMVFGSLKQDIKKTGKVTVSEFGTFKIKRTKAKKKRKGRNPFTGEEIWLKGKPAGKKVKFTPGKALKRF